MLKDDKELDACYEKFILDMLQGLAMVSFSTSHIDVSPKAFSEQSYLLVYISDNLIGPDLSNSDFFSSSVLAVNIFRPD